MHNELAMHSRALPFVCCFGATIREAFDTGVKADGVKLDKCPLPLNDPCDEKFHAPNRCDWPLT
jgi:hypothetical protein